MLKGVFHSLAKNRKRKLNRLHKLILFGFKLKRIDNILFDYIKNKSNKKLNQIDKLYTYNSRQAVDSFIR